jgi:hypothetical protein
VVYGVDMPPACDAEGGVISVCIFVAFLTYCTKEDSIFDDNEPMVF